MKAAQITRYAKDNQVKVVDIPIPEISKNEVLVNVQAAAVNPLEVLNLTGAVKLIQDYDMPLTLGNEMTGIIEKVGANVTNYQVGDRVYTRLPLEKIGAFAEYVAVDQQALDVLPKHLDFVTGVAIPLTGLTAYQAFTEILRAKKGQTVFIPGASGGFGQLAVPIAKSFGLHVIVSGNAKSRERLLKAGADQYLDYKTENYWEILEPVDIVIDTLGAHEIDHELMILKPGGKLLSLNAGPNKQFAIDQKMPFWKQVLFGLVGAKLDKKAQKKGATYHFMFVHSDGEQLKKVSKIVEEQQIVPLIDPHVFTLTEVNEAINYVKEGHPNGKVIIKM